MSRGPDYGQPPFRFTRLSDPEGSTPCILPFPSFAPRGLLILLAADGRPDYLCNSNASHEGGPLTLPRAILFDLDDTFLDAGRRLEVLQSICRQHGRGLHPFAPDEIARLLDSALAEFWSDPERHRIARFGLPQARRQVFAETFAATGCAHLTVDFAHRLADRFTDVRDEIAACFPGAREALAALKARGVLLALVTNGGSATQRAKIERFNLAPLFHHIQIEGEHDFGKPDERAYRHAMAALGVEPHECWMVGDHLEWEVAAPQRLGIFAVWCDSAGTGLPEGCGVTPDRIVRAVAELVGG